MGWMEETSHFDARYFIQSSCLSRSVSEDRVYWLNTEHSQMTSYSDEWPDNPITASSAAGKKLRIKKNKSPEIESSLDHRAIYAEM